MSMRFKDWVMEQQENIVDLTYVADRLTELADVKDKDLRKYVVEFREECLRNLGVNALHDHNN